MSLKRPWFRFHLLTLVLMMVAASVWLLLTLRLPKSNDSIEDFHVMRQIQRSTGYGLPLTFLDIGVEATQLVHYDHDDKFRSSIVIDSHPIHNFQFVSFALDMLIWSGSILSVAFASEFILRRREGRTP